MSQETVEAVRRAFESYHRGDLDAAFQFVDPDVVFRPAETWEALRKEPAR